MISKQVFERELWRLTLSVILLRVATRQGLMGGDQDEVRNPYFTDAAKEQAVRSLTQLSDAPALRPRHLTETANLKQSVDRAFSIRFVPAYNEAVRRYNERFPDDELPELVNE